MIGSSNKRMVNPRIMVVFGTRPDAIKLAPLIKILDADPGFDFFLVNTGQHEKRVIDNIMRFFGCCMNWINLAVMRKDQTPNDVMVNVMNGMSSVIGAHVPDIVVVQGDTSSALAAALAAFNLGVPVAHVEAGLRTWDIRNPWPEESNRLCIDRISDMLFVPTASAFANLRRENIDANKELVVGNTSVDSQLFCCQQIIEEGFTEIAVYSADVPHIFVTVHRRENFGKPMEDICAIAKELAVVHPDINFIWPVHLNPNVREVIPDLLKGHGNIKLCEPFNYMTSMFMIGTSLMVMTDSGGVQEEAAGFAVPTIILREKTDRLEHEAAGRSRDRAMLIDYMANYKDKVKVVGHDKDAIAKAFGSVLHEALKRREKQYMTIQGIFGSFHPLYGDGLASQRIAAHLRRRFGMEPEMFPEPSIFQS